jgi:chromatin-remodeling ATPase INO80
MLSRPGLGWFVPPVVAPPVTMYCPNRTFVERQATLLEAPFESLALYGLTPALCERAEPSSLYTQLVSGLPSTGLISNSSRDQIPAPKMQVPEAKSLVFDSAKLARLDSLLQELKAGDHRVLIYFQMTRMMDLMEEYLIYRQYKYLRLDGSSKLEDRRDMVMDWQTR